MNHFRGQHFAAWHFAANQFRGVAVTPQPDTHDGFGYWEKYWRKLHEKKKPTLAEVVEIVQENPVEALKAVPEARKQFQGIDYGQITQSYEMAQFIAKQLIITLELRRRENEDEESAIEMLLLM
jgi:hypothetical protein